MKHKWKLPKFLQLNLKLKNNYDLSSLAFYLKWLASASSRSLDIKEGSQYFCD